MDEYGTDPLDDDSDDGGVDDGTEVDRGTDPLEFCDDFGCDDTGLAGKYKGGWGDCACSSQQRGLGAFGAWALLALGGLLLVRRREG